jgi:hypothetical protein
MSAPIMLAVDRRLAQFLAASALIWSPYLVAAGTVDPADLNTFVNGTVADAEQVNGNFNTLRAEIDDNAGKLAATSNDFPDNWWTPGAPGVHTSQGFLATQGFFGETWSWNWYRTDVDTAAPNAQERHSLYVDDRREAAGIQMDQRGIFFYVEEEFGSADLTNAAPKDRPPTTAALLDIQGNFSLEGFTALGDGAPAIKMQLVQLTLDTASFWSTVSNVHPANASQVLSATALCQDSSSRFRNSGVTDSGAQSAGFAPEQPFHVEVRNQGAWIRSDIYDSSVWNGRPCNILITYVAP